MKKIILHCLLAVVSVVILTGVFLEMKSRDRTQEQRAEELEALNEKIAPLQSKVISLQKQIDRIRQEEFETETTPTVVCGYYASNVDEIAADGVIVLDANADTELIAAAEATGRDIAYFYALDAEVPENRTMTILRSQYDSSKTRAGIDGIISCHLDRNAAGVLDDGKVNLPYVYIKNDLISLKTRLDALKSELFVIFNPNVKSNVELFEQYVDDGKVVKTEIREAVTQITERSSQEDDFEADRQARIDEISRQIDEIQSEIQKMY